MQDSQEGSFYCFIPKYVNNQGWIVADRPNSQHVCRRCAQVPWSHQQLAVTITHKKREACDVKARRSAQQVTNSSAVAAVHMLQRAALTPFSTVGAAGRMTLR